MGNSNIKADRSFIFPIWIRFLAFFFLFGYFSPIVWYMNIDSIIKKFNYLGPVYSEFFAIPASILGMVLSVLYAHTARGIIWGKDYAIEIGRISVYFGMFVSVSIMVCTLHFNGKIDIQFQLIFQYLFLRALNKNEEEWLAYPHSSGELLEGIENNKE